MAIALRRLRPDFHSTLNRVRGCPRHCHFHLAYWLIDPRFALSSASSQASASASCICASRDMRPARTAGERPPQLAPSLPSPFTGSPKYGQGMSHAPCPACAFARAAACAGGRACIAQPLPRGDCHKPIIPLAVLRSQPFYLSALVRVGNRLPVIAQRLTHALLRQQIRGAGRAADSMRISLIIPVRIFKPVYRGADTLSPFYPPSRE